MSKKNSVYVVFLHINMHGGDPVPCWEWTRPVRGGGKDSRPYFSINGKKRLAYRIAYELVTGEKIPPGTVLRHTCDNGAAPVRCCNPYHLVKGTHKENMKDMTDRERHGQSKHVVRAIRKLASEGVTHAEIAKRFGLSRRNVTAIVNEETYKDA